MFTFFHKRKIITLDCFISNQNIYNAAPIRPAIHYIPEWFKSLPNKEHGFQKTKNNMKACYGFIEMNKRGVILPYWGHMNFRVEKDKYLYEYATGDAPTEHHASQYNYAYPNFHHIKLNSPWAFREKTGLQFIFIDPVWHTIDRPCKALNGILEFDLNRSTNVNFFIEKKEEPYDFSINIGEPVAQIIPLADDVKLKVNNHLVDELEYKKQTSGYGPLYNYYDVVKLRKRFNGVEKKCPIKW